ncbi:DMT family transporter [Siculibacillus lacustris]|uniref:DMT family transporter n=1 Tax=Siculibacillus lacustris TaxID=1549641 RepID=A0A4Q9VXC2_9HYPH|nr:DMT family transporter [Siculibacillus lacustris]TBW39967.1 DMT family transporter [Siculibacillus lacustris]
MFRGSLSAALAPVSFVMIWSTGWVAGRYAVIDADPLTFLVVRFAAALMILTALALAIRAPWPSSRAAVGHAMASGVLLHGVYLGGVWWAIGHGVPAGLSAVIAASQPLMTAALAPWLAGERIGPKRMTGFAIGFLGIALVVAPKLAAAGGAADGIALPIAVNVAAMLAVTLGTFYQKRFVASGHLVSVAALQYVGAAAVLLPVAAAIEPMRFHLTPTSGLTLAWSVIGLSIGAIGLLLHLIRRGEVSRAASLIYLVPPAAVLQAWLLFGETLSPVQIVGMAVAAVGVALANRG